LEIRRWEDVYQEALHSIRSLLCTATNSTPHERMFNFSRRSTNGKTIPSWLMNPGPVLMKRPVRNSKYEPLVEEVLLLEGNPEYSHVKMPDGRETTVSTRHLAPVASNDENFISEETENDESEFVGHELSKSTDIHEQELNLSLENGQLQPQVTTRQSSRNHRPPHYLKDYYT